MSEQNVAKPLTTPEKRTLETFKHADGKMSQIANFEAVKLQRSIGSKTRLKVCASNTSQSEPSITGFDTMHMIIEKRSMCNVVTRRQYRPKESKRST